MKTPNLVLAVATLFLASALPAQEAAVKAGEAMIRKYDTNADTRVEFREFKEDAEAFKKLDKNGDGYLSVADFVQKQPSKSDDSMKMMNEREYFRYLGFQTVPRYDRDRDGVLDESELTFLVFTVMDYDEDRVLNALEIRKSRNPPGLALEDGWFQKDAKMLDQNGDTVVTMAEMRVPEVVLRGLDKNKDGKVSLEEMARAQVAVMGGYLPRFHELSEAIGRLGKLDKANWMGDPDMFHRLDEDRDSAVSVAEFDRYSRALKTVIEMCPDFVTRHDIDGDLKVSRREFPGTDSMFARMDRNRDGVITAQDR